jgi:cell wall-associated NlpC family hydrolase
MFVRRTLAVVAFAFIACVAVLFGDAPTVPVAQHVPANLAPISSVAATTSTVQSVAVQAPLATTAPAVAGADVRTVALQNALSKLGAPYRYGAKGPVAFDCSGLVWWAYKQEGIELPRSSHEQAKVGTPVARADLRPGDLVFFYRPIGHVAIYIGDGKVVNASNRRAPVKISNMNYMAFTTARRIG